MLDNPGTMNQAQAAKHTRTQPYIGRLKALNPTDYVQTRMSVPASLVARLHDIKRQNGLRTRDAVIGAMLRIARTQHSLAEFRLPPEPPEDDPLQPITAEVQAEQLEFLYRLQRQFRGAALGAALEAVASVVTDLAPPVQLTLIDLTEPAPGAVEWLSVRESTSGPGLVLSRTVSGAASL